MDKAIWPCGKGEKKKVLRISVLKKKKKRISVLRGGQEGKIAIKLNGDRWQRGSRQIKCENSGFEYFKKEKYIIKYSCEQSKARTDL